MSGRGSPNQVREQIRQELTQWTPHWEHCLSVFTENEMLPEEDLSALLTLTQRTRNFFRLLDDPDADNAAVALESLLTLTPTPVLLDEARFCKAIRMGIQSLCDASSRYPEDGCAAMLQTPPEIPPLPFVEQRLMVALNQASILKECPSPCDMFSIIHSENDTEALRMRGLDLFRLEQESFSLYLIEIAWEEVLDRNGSLSQMLENLGRNGYVFDIRPASSFLEPLPETPPGEILRVLHASPLDVDFVEALTRLPVQHIHSVNAGRIRRNQPSWGKTSGSSVPTCFSCSRECGKNIQELISDYDLAFASLIKRSKQEIPAFAASPTFSDMKPEVSSLCVLKGSPALSAGSGQKANPSEEQANAAGSGKTVPGSSRSEELLKSLFF